MEPNKVHFTTSVRCATGILLENGSNVIQKTHRNGSKMIQTSWWKKMKNYGKKNKKKLCFRNGSKKWWKTMANIHRKYRNMGKRKGWEKLQVRARLFRIFRLSTRAPGPGGPQGIHCDHHLHHIAKGGIQHPSLITEATTMPWNGIPTSVSFYFRWKYVPSGK